jgi:hypothetical protein
VDQIDACHFGRTNYLHHEVQQKGIAGTTPFYGREHELRRLQELAGKKTATVNCGEPGHCVTTYLRRVLDYVEICAATI